jgi:hypothetical protein
VYGLLMLALAVGVTGPAGHRRFPLPLARLFLRAFCTPLAIALPGAVVVAWRPRVGPVLLDLLIDAALFVVLCAPGLEFARRRFGLPLGFGARA